MADGNHRPSSPAALRKQAARARRWAEHLMGDEAEERLRKLADELEATAAAIEQSQPTSSGLP
jgi:hypothetical protein